MKSLLISAAFLLIAVVFISVACVSDGSDAESTEFTVGDLTYEVTSGLNVKVIDNSCYGYVTIPSEVTHNSKTYTVVSIGESAFESSYFLRSVVIPDSVTTIESRAFAYCERLLSVTIGENVSTIGESAFIDCTSLTDITFPDSVETIGDRSFERCILMKTIHIGSGLHDLNVTVFTDCVSLESYSSSNSSYYKTDGGILFNSSGTELISYPANKSGAMYVTPSDVTSIGDYAFSGCRNLTTVTLSDSVEVVGVCAFLDCSSLSYIGLSDSMTAISGGMFIRCTSLATIDISEQIRIIGDSAFAECTFLSSISLGKNIISIGDGAFNFCSALKSISVSENNPGYASDKDVLFDKAKNRLIHYPAGKTDKSYIFPTNVKTIDDFAFYQCSSLSDIGLPKQLTSIGNSAFGHCTALLRVELPNNLNTLGAGAFSECTSLKSVKMGSNLTVIKNFTFYGCTSLTSVTFGDNIDTIESYAFEGCSIRTAALPDSLVSIGSYAFYNCSYLTSVSVGSSLNSIGTNAFYNCYRLVEICNASLLDLKYGSSDFGYIAQYAINIYSKDVGTSLLDSIELSGGATGIYIRDDSYYALLAVYGGDGTLVLPDSIEDNSYVIHDNAFREMTNLTSVTLGSNITSIGKYSFSNCSITELVIPDGVLKIYKSAFSGCKQLVKVTVGHNVNLIEGNAFAGCYNLKEICDDSLLGIEVGSTDHGAIAQYAKNVYSSTVGESILKYSQLDDGSVAVYIEEWDKVTLIAVYGFESIIELPDLLGGMRYEIDPYAFYGYTGLVELIISSGVSGFDTFSLETCTSLRSIDVSGGKYFFFRGRCVV